MKPTWRPKVNDPFTKARIRLTSWYGLILIVLIGFFTFLTFQAKESAYVRVYGVVKNSTGGENRLVELQDTYSEFNRRFKVRVLMFDGVLVISGGYLAWWLAGKTLQPIREMMAEQQAFAQDLSHGLKTPLTSMKLLIEAHNLTHHKMPIKEGKLLAALSYELQHMQAIVGGVLTLNLAGLKPAPPERINWDGLARHLYESLLPLAQVKTIKFRPPPAKTGIKLWGNGDQIGQALMTILDNAIKYTPKRGEICLLAKKSQALAIIQVTDTGPGIKPTDKRKIFEKYYRGREENKSQGTGLGLAIAKRLVEANRGIISVKDNPTGGSVFTVKLPLAMPESNRE